MEEKTMSRNLKDRSLKKRLGTFAGIAFGSTSASLSYHHSVYEELKPSSLITIHHHTQPGTQTSFDVFATNISWQMLAM
jgi:hypothetical protein